MIKYLIPRDRSNRLWTVTPDKELRLGFPLADGNRELVEEFGIMVEELAAKCDEERAIKKLWALLREDIRKAQAAYQKTVGSFPVATVLAEMDNLSCSSFERPEDGKKVVYANQAFAVCFLKQLLDSAFNDCQVKKLPYE